MEAEEMMEWGLVRDRAVAHLRECRHIDTSKHRPLAQFLIIPSFEDTIAVDIVHSQQQLAAYVTLWRSTIDINAFASPVERLRHPRPFLPTYESHQACVPTQNLAELLEQFSQIVLPLSATTNTISLDGTSYELRSGDGYSGIRLHWHNRLPEAWSMLDMIVDTMSTLAEDVRNAMK